MVAHINTTHAPARSAQALQLCHEHLITDLDEGRLKPYKDPRL